MLVGKMSVLRVSSFICLDSAACSFQKTGIKNLRARMPCVRSGIRSLWSIPRFQHIASVVREQRGNWRGCSNQSSGDNNAVVPAKLQRPKDFDVIDNFQPVISLRKGMCDDILMKLSMPTADNWGYEDLSTADSRGIMDDDELYLGDEFGQDSSICEQLEVLKQQIKCSNEELFSLRERLRKLEEENTNLDREASLSVNKILRMRYSLKETYERD